MNDIQKARNILVDIAKRKGYYDESYQNFLVTPEELAPYLAETETNYNIKVNKDGTISPEDATKPSRYINVYPGKHGGFPRKNRLTEQEAGE